MTSRGEGASSRVDGRHNGHMEVSAKVDYGMRALLVLTQAHASGPSALTKTDAIAKDQGIPPKFLEGILGQLRASGLVVSQRGAEGGFRLARAPAEISVADVVRALDGPLAAVRGRAPEDAEYQGASEHLSDVWIATRAAVRTVMENASLADIASGALPDEVAGFLAQPGAYERR